MQSRQNPFSLYDFLGYFIPGAITLYLLIFAYFHSESQCFNRESLENAINFFEKDIYIPFIIISYILGHLLSFVSSITIEKYANWMSGYPSKYLLGQPSECIFKPKLATIRRLIARIFVCLLIFPVFFFDVILGYVMNLRDLYIKEVSDVSKQTIKEAIFALYNLPEEIDREQWLNENSFFRYCYHFALENSKTHGPKFQNYVALFGFTRTVTLIFVLFFWIFVWHAMEGRFSMEVSVWLIVSSGITAYIFYIAFNKFYRRFSLETLMALSAVLNSDGRVSL